MLKFTLKVGECFDVDENSIVTVRSIDGDTVTVEVDKELDDDDWGDEEEEDDD